MNALLQRIPALCGVILAAAMLPILPSLAANNEDAESRNASGGGQPQLLRMATPPVNVNISAAGTLPEGVFFSALNVSFASKRHSERGASAANSPYVDSSIWLLKLRYGLTDNLELAAITPYLDISRSHPTPEPKRLNGVGDQIVGLSYAPFNTRLRDPFSLHLTAALALPTGGNSRDNPPGNGVYGWRLSMTYGLFVTENVRFDTEIVWSGPFERGNQKVKRGQNVQWNAQLRRPYQHFDLGLESNVVWQDSGDVKTPVGKRNLRNGYTEWFVGPSANVAVNSLGMWMGAGVFFPVSRHFDGPSRSERSRLEFKLGKIW